MQQHRGSLVRRPSDRTGGCFGSDPRRGGSLQRNRQDGRRDGGARSACAAGLLRGFRWRRATTRDAGNAIGHTAGDGDRASDAGNEWPRRKGRGAKGGTSGDAKPSRKGRRTNTSSKLPLGLCNANRRRAGERHDVRNATRDANVAPAVGMLPPKQTLESASARVRQGTLSRFSTEGETMVALGAKQARKMAQIASALTTPHQPSRDHKVVTQRLPKGDRPRGSRGVRTRHGGTKLGGGHDKSGWVGRGRGGAGAQGTRAVVIAAASSSSGKGALQHRSLAVSRGVEADDWHG